jgi:UDP-glucose 4-epimerase
MNQILQGQAMTIFGDGTQTRAFTYIDDVAPLLAEAIDVDAAWNQVFNIGADRPSTLNDLARAVADAMDVTADIRHVPSRPEVHHAHSSHEKVRRVFGDRRSTPLADGLRATADWVRSHGPRPRTVFRGIEIERNLPDVWRQG